MQNKKLQEKWNSRWESSHTGKHSTFLSRRMMKVKKKILRKITENIDVKTVIDVGCGIGRTLEVFRDAGLDYLGIDASPEAISICREKQLCVLHKNLDEVEETYDLVFSDGMLEHFLNFELYAKKMMQISKKYVLLIQPNHGSFVGKTLVYFAELLRGRINVYEYNYRIQDFIETFEANDFSISENHSIFLDVYRILLFKRKNSKQP
jgi:2-polyprenyl-3-methyl-5-hydroxy-6-metoxy-1,4-benzoquinol methylase